MTARDVHVQRREQDDSRVEVEQHRDGGRAHPEREAKVPRAPDRGGQRREEPEPVEQDREWDREHEERQRGTERTQRVTERAPVDDAGDEREQRDRGRDHPGADARRCGHAARDTHHERADLPTHRRTLFPAPSSATRRRQRSDRRGSAAWS
jgi:hypothetical protein